MLPLSHNRAQAGLVPVAFRLPTALGAEPGAALLADPSAAVEVPVAQAV